MAILSVETQRQLAGVWRDQIVAPFNKAQWALATCSVPDIFFGGNRGGGKSFGLLLKWLYHSKNYGEYCRGLILRRTFAELEQIIEESHRIFGSDQANNWSESRKSWRMGNGAVLRLRYLEKEKDASRYQGQSNTFIGVDEVGNYKSLSIVDELRATLRSAAGVPCQMVLTGNPGGKCHDELRARYIDPSPAFRPFLDPLTGMARVYIPARLQDNPLLLKNDPEYVKRIISSCSGRPWLLRAWLYGDWDIQPFDSEFETSWWQYYPWDPNPAAILRTLPPLDGLLQSWDFTFKGEEAIGNRTSWVVGQVWGWSGSRFYLLDQVRGQWNVTRTISAIRALTERWPQVPTKLYEDKANGPAIYTLLSGEIPGLIPVQVTQDKAARARAILPYAQAGNIWLPDPASCKWVSGWIGEFNKFPGNMERGGVNDQIDAASQALAHISKLLARQQRSSRHAAVSRRTG